MDEVITAEHFTTFKGDAKSLSPLALAFVGDGVFELLVRGHLMEKNTIPVRKLHKKSVELVNAEAQAEMFQLLQPSLTEVEESILRRGRNATVSRVPKNSTVEDYHKATAVEALFGYLYLDGQLARVLELFNIIISNSNLEQ